MRTKALLLIFLCSILLCGCQENVKIFENDDDLGVQIPVKSDELEIGEFYVKDGTIFYKTLKPQGSAASNALNPSEADSYISIGGNKKRVLYARKYEDTTIPTHYKNEIVAQASGAASTLDDVVLERFRDIGYSVGIYNATYDPVNNSLNFNMSEKAIQDTDAREKLSDLESDEIRITEIDHQPLTNKNIDKDGGFFINLMHDKEYTLSLYAGTYYHEIEVKADTQLLQSFEVFYYDSSYISDTPNGYRCFNTPANLKSGYYCINGGGLFRYVDFSKGEKPLNQVDYNERYYNSDAEMLAQFAKQFTVTLEKRTKNMTIKATYDDPDNFYTKDDIIGYVFSPDGTIYYMEADTKNKEVKIDLTEAMPGKWTIDIIPKSLAIIEIKAIDNTPDREFTQEDYRFSLNSPRENAVLRVYFSNDIHAELNDIEITGTIVMPDGQTYELEKKSEKDLAGEEFFYLQKVLPYAAAGEYEVMVNHFPEKTTVSTPQIENNTETYTETIVIE